MTSLTVTLYGTSELWNNKGDAPLLRTKEYLSGAFDRDTHNNSINISISSNEINSPSQERESSFTAPYPCDPLKSMSYNNLGEWWKDKVQCTLDESPDADILITNSSGGDGICYNNQYAVAEGGPLLPDLPWSYTDRGYGDEFSAMQTVLHEAGHAFISLSDEHDSGNVTKHNGRWYRTPMTYGGSGSHYNECGHWVSSDHDNGHEEMRYSECVQENIENN